MKISRPAVITFSAITIFVCALWALVGLIPAVILGLTSFLLGFIAIWGLVTLLIPSRSLAERNLISLLMVPLFFSIGAWVSSFTGLYDCRFIPSILGICISIAVFLRRRGNRTNNDRPNDLTAIYWGWLIGVLALIPVLLVTMASQHISGLSDIKLYNDVPWQIAMTSETLVRAPEFFPFIDNEKLAYPWSFHGFLGSLGSFSGLTASTLFTTVWPLYYTVLAPLAITVFSWRLTKNYWTTTLSPLILVFFIGPTLPMSESLRFPLTYSISPTFEYGLLALLSFLIYLSFAKPKSWSGQWASFFFAFATVFVASGSKGSNGLIVVTIMVFYFLQSVISKKDLKYTLIQSIFAALGAVAAYTMTISGSSGNLSIGPLSFLSSVDSKTIPLMFVVVCFVWLLGSFFIINKYSNQPSRIVLSSFAAVASGVFFMALFGHPGLSQIYFYWSVVPILAILGTWAIVLLFKVLGGIVLIPLISSWLISQICDSQISYFFDPTDYAKIKWPLIWLVGLIIFGIAISLAKSNTKITRHFLVLSLAGAAVCSLAAQPFGTFRQVYSGPQAIDGVEITSDQLQAFSYLRDHTTPDEVLASNRHCLAPTSDVPGCDSRYVSLSAFSERRVLIEGHYKETETKQAETLALNEAFIYNPDAQLYKQMWERGVRYIYIDKTVGLPGDLSQFGKSVYDSENAQVWKLAPPQ